MIIWKKLLKNIIIAISNVLITGFMLYLEIVNSKNENNEVNSLLIFANFLIFIFFNFSTFLLIVHNPCILQTYPMTTECVACWNSSKVSCVKCHRCKNVALCIECYHEWRERGNNCPLCRAYYIV